MDDIEFESPHHSKWIMAVDDAGNATILRRPNINPGFFDCGDSAEEMGMPFEDINAPAGVYEWTCSYSESTDYESGMVDDWYFEPISEICLYALESPQ